MNNPIDELYNNFIEQLQSERTAIDSEYVLIAPKGFRLDVEKIRSTPELVLFSHRKEYNHLKEIVFISDLAQISIVYEYEPRHAKYLNNLLNRVYEEDLVSITKENDYKTMKLWRVRSRTGSYLVFPLCILGTLGLNDYSLAKEDWVRDYNKYTTSRLAEFTGIPNIYHLKINWTNFPRKIAEEFDYMKPLEIRIGIKSQYPVLLALYPRDPKDSKYMTLVHKYSDRKPIRIQFEFNKASVVYPLIASFLYVLKNKKPALLSSKDVKEILREYNVAIPGNKSISDMGRLQKSLLEKIRDVSDEKARKHLLHIFKKNGNFFRLETSFEIDKS